MYNLPRYSRRRFFIYSLPAVGRPTAAKQSPLINHSFYRNVRLSLSKPGFGNNIQLTQPDLTGGSCVATTVLNSPALSPFGGAQGDNAYKPI
jgi:hypothetical protein